ncbi:MAG: M48 family metallopeptidase [Bdellovibrionales bacterium]
MAFWRKPLTRREETLDFRNQTVRVLRRAFQRSLRMQVKPDGSLLLTAGMTLPNQQLLRFLQDSWSWVEKNQNKMLKLKERHPKPTYQDGEQLLFLGSPRVLQYRSSHNHVARLRLENQTLFAEVPLHVWSKFQPQAPHPEWRQPVRRFFESGGRKLLTSRVEVFSRLMRLQPTGLSFRCQRTRWGSCSSRGKLSLNWRLIAAPVAVLDYVVIHELAHLRFPNHSAKFWCLVQQYCANYEQHNKWLRDNHLALDFLL